ncbi:IS1182 family transposase, partial [Clostridium tarantellae]|uniref:IS1182 family transposase n=1 Tax=Clostridium tarantellae TaxID=39493 RepID=UPI003BEF4ACF
MMTKKNTDNRFKIEFNSLEALVPKNHLVRQIDRAIDFNFIYDEVAELYSAFGAPSIDPVVLIKIVLIQYLFGIPSMRQTIREIEVNIAYRWFLGYSFNEKIPHFSTFGKNYVRRFKDTELFNIIFSRILEEANKNGFIQLDEIYIDSTHIKASANKKKYTKVKVETETKKYQSELDKEINEDRKKHGKKTLKEKEKTKEVKEIVESKTDKDSGMFFKNEKEKCFAYLAHTACDDNNYILDFHITPGNIHDSVAFSDLYSKLHKKYPNDITAIAVDAGYITPYICKTLFEDNILPAMPYKRPMTKQGFFKKYEYVYDEFNDCYICPNNKILKYSTTNKDGYREYKSSQYDCKMCPLINQCTKSKNAQKVVTRHVWQHYVEEANHLRHNEYIKQVYSRRKETIERVFADAKERHGMRYTHLRGLAKLTMEVTLIFACMNLKKLAKRKWIKTGGYLGLYHNIKNIFEKFRNFAYKTKNSIFALCKNAICLQT